MKVLWAIVCEGSSVDRESNNISLFNVLEQVQFLEPPEADSSGDLRPAIAMHFRLVILFSRTDPGAAEKRASRIVLHFPTDAEPAVFPQSEIDLEVALRNRLVSRFPLLPINGQGTYRFVIEGLADSLEWQRLFEIPLEVSFQSQE